jgi:hypothetical protein
MSVAHAPELHPRMQRAVEELQGLIARRYPDAQFRVGPSQDDPAIVHLTATLDVDDTEEVVDLVIDRMMELQIEEGLPIYVIPLRTPERVAGLTQSQLQLGRPLN